MNIRNPLISDGRRQMGGFTLIEMIGVLAIIALLAAMVLPKVADAISDAKINNVIASYQSIQAATASHYGKYLAYNSFFGTNTSLYPIPIFNYDSVFLMPEGFLDHPFQPKCGGPNAVVQVVNASTANNGQGYYFTGFSNSVAAATAGYQYVVECVLTNVSPADAFGISLALEGVALTPAYSGLPDTAGKVTYYPTLNGGTVYMYVDGR